MVRKSVIANGLSIQWAVLKKASAGLWRILRYLMASHILFPAFAVFVLGIIWGATLHLIRVERAAAEYAAAASSQELVETYEARVRSALSDIDQTLKFVQYAVELKGKQHVLQELKAKSLLPPDLLFVVSIADSKGDVVASTHPSAMLNIADQASFRNQLQTNAISVELARPNPGSDEWKLQFSRRLDATDGSFSGIVMISVDAAYFVSSYESSQLGKHGVLGILGTDGVFRVRRSGETVTAGDMGNYVAMVPATNAAETKTTFLTSPWDSVQRYTSARQIHEFPLAVVVGISADERLADTRRNMHTYLWRASIGSLVLILIVAALGRMSRQLANSQSQLLVAARMAGMAEIATNILHNVGNVLNSVNISADLVSTQLRTSKLKGLARAIHLIDEHKDNLGEFLTHDAKGKLLPTYLRELAPALELEHATMAEELCVLSKSVDHIKEIVATQQSYAGASHVVEFVKLGNLVDDALRMNAEALARHKVNVANNIADLPALPLDRHRVLQILINLISNAKQAMNGRTDKSPYITLSATLIDGRSLHITVADNGEGIAPENLTRIFSHGFTTRKNGHGFGLHSCILAAQEMGGNLTARSDGLGQGASFILEIPLPTIESKQ